jgi:hypothetical protein
MFAISFLASFSFAACSFAKAEALQFEINGLPRHGHLMWEAFGASHPRSMPHCMYQPDIV